MSVRSKHINVPNPSKFLNTKLFINEIIYIPHYCCECTNEFSDRPDHMPAEELQVLHSHEYSQIITHGTMVSILSNGPFP